MSSETTQQIAQSAQPALDQAITMLSHWLDAGANFASQQAPELAHEIVRWGIAQHSCGAVIGVLLLGVAVWLLRYCARECAKDYYECREDAAFFSGLGGIVAGAVGVVVFFSNVFSVLQAIFAPRLYLIEYLGGLLK